MYTFTNAKIEVARTMGGQNDPDETLAAGFAINKAIKMWNREHVWEFLRLDNLLNFVVPSSTTITSTTVTLPAGVSFPDFSNVYVGTKISGPGIPAGATVTAKASNSSLTISAAATATASPVNLIFSGPIPILVGVSDYALPYRIVRSNYARLVTARVSLLNARSRQTNHVEAPDLDQGGVWGYEFQPIQGAPDANGILPLPSTVLRLYDTPTEADTLIFEGFRSIQTFLNDLSAADEARTLDVPEEFEDDLLESAAYFYENNKDSEVTRTQDKKQNAWYFLRRAIRRDLQQPDEDVRFIPFMEAYPPMADPRFPLIQRGL